MEYFHGSGDAGLKKYDGDISVGIQETDVSWMDLSLDFLWWRNARHAGKEALRGRNCYIIEVDAPAGTASRYTRVRLWIDDVLFMLMQARAYSSDGEVIRELWVKSFKKIGDKWMIKDIEIQSYPSVHRTKLAVDDFSVAGGADNEGRGASGEK